MIGEIMAINIFIFITKTPCAAQSRGESKLRSCFSCRYFLSAPLSTTPLQLHSAPLSFTPLLHSSSAQHLSAPLHSTSTQHLSAPLSIIPTVQETAICNNLFIIMPTKLQKEKKIHVSKKTQFKQLCQKTTFTERNNYYTCIGCRTYD